MEAQAAAGFPEAQGVLARMGPMPELMAGGSFFLDGFWKLSTTRSCGWGEGPIPFTAVLEYCRLYELSEDDASEFEEVIFAMDRKYLECQAAKQKTSTKA